MSYEAIRGMTGESFIEWCERNDYDLSSDSARRLLIEAKALLKEHDRAVALLEELIEFHDEDQEGSGDEWNEFIERVDEFLCPTLMNVALGLHGLEGKQ